MHGSGINSKKIQKMCNSAIRFAYNLKYNEHISPFIIKSNLVPMKKRRELHIASMAYKIVNNIAPPYLNHLISINRNPTRSANKFTVMKPINNLHKKSFNLSVPKIWNNINESIRNKKNYRIL